MKEIINRLTALPITIQQTIRDNKDLKNLCYLTYGGSIAYGTNNENSDIDLRGIAVENLSDIILNKEFEVYDSTTDDFVVYGLKKFIKLCESCNPNVLEMLGTKEEHILYMNDIGNLIRDNRHLFYSKRAFKTFVGYATAQLRRLQNALCHDSYDEKEKKHHILKSINSMMLSTKAQYGLTDDNISFDMVDNENECEMYTSVTINHMPLRKFVAINNELNNMLRNYEKLNNRNKKKDQNHLNKHAMHLIRLYYSGLDILEGRGIITYRENEIDILRGIRNGDITLDEVYKLVDELDIKLKKAFKETILPDAPNMEGIENMLLSIYLNKY